MPVEKMLFGTKEWLDAFMNRLNADERYRELATDYEGNIIFRCYADPGVHELLSHDLEFYFDPYHGEIRDWRILEPGETIEVEYELSGKYPVWKRVASGELALKKAVIMTHEIKVKGKVSDLVKHIAAADRIIEVLTEMRDVYLFPDE